MAKTKTSTKKTANRKTSSDQSVITATFDKLTTMFPNVKVTRYSERHPGERLKAGRDIIVDIRLPKEFTLMGTGISASGEVTKIAFKSSKKSAIYVFTLDPQIPTAV